MMPWRKAHRAPGGVSVEFAKKFPTTLPWLSRVFRRAIEGIRMAERNLPEGLGTIAPKISTGLTQTQPNQNLG
ncbi:MAG TPA: hypothetical protein VFQ00_02345 [Terriglobales bacterium]|nr:hypothetical protein [Terriglobales bacterium]